MYDIKSTAMNDEMVHIDGTPFYVYYDFHLSKDTTDFALQPTYEVQVRQCFNLKGEPVEPTAEQTARIEEILIDRLKNNNGSAWF